MILRIVHATLLPGKKEEFLKFINSKLVPATQTNKGRLFSARGFCVEEGHENEVIFVSGWDSLESAEAFENAPTYGELAPEHGPGGIKAFYTHRYSEHGAVHIHYKTFTTDLFTNAANFK
ncbi:MAG: hypothetical protein IT529_19160 [Burkholderiales bacterium]|nr:hypothetical protein [Burkholderiales bacterium]